MEMFAVGSVAVVAIMAARIRRQRKSMLHANDWITNRVGQTIQGASGGGGGSALGMGAAGSGNSMSTAKMVATLGMLNTLGGNPLLEWAAGGTPNFLHPLSGRQAMMTRKQARMWGLPWMEGAQTQGMMNRLTFAKAAQLGATKYGGINTVLGAAAAANSVFDQHGGIPDLRGALVGAGFSKEWIIENVPRSWGKAFRAVETYPLQDKNLAMGLAATQRASESARSYSEAPLGDAHKRKEEVAADFAVLRALVKQHRAVHSGGVTLDPVHEQFARDYFDNPNAKEMTALQALHGLTGTQTWTDLSAAQQTEFSTISGRLPGLTSERAGRIIHWIQNEGAKNWEDKTDALLRDRTNYEALRDVRRAGAKVQDIEGFKNGKTIDILHAPDSATSNEPRNYRTRMGQIPLGDVPPGP